MSDKFVNIKLTRENLDIYLVRTSIFKALNSKLGFLSGKLLDVGCGKMPYRSHVIQNSKVTEYVGLDIEQAIIYDEKTKPDITWDGITMPVGNSSFDCALATEVLEHCPYPEVVLKEVYRVLKPGGCIFITVPFCWPLHEVPFDEYRYTPFSLERILKNSGFENIEIKALGGWHASMAQNLGLWVKRAPMPTRYRKILSILIYPFYKKLIRIDVLPQEFLERTMITGLEIFATKKIGSV